MPDKKKAETGSKTRKRILIVSLAMEIGGAERALLGFLEQLDTEKYEVDLFLLRHQGELYDLIPDKVRLLPEVPAYSVLARPMIQTLKEGHVLLTAARLRGRYAAKRYVKEHNLGENDVAIEYSHKYTKNLMPPIQPDVEYDLVISFLMPHYFAAEKVRAKKRIAWIHTDYSTVQVDVDSQVKMWSQFDAIISISEDVTKGFTKVFPSLADRIVLIENIQPVSLIQRQVMEPVEEGFFCGNMPAEASGESRLIKILSIGRFSPQKNFDNIPDICRKILASGLNVRWYLIGYGGDEDLIRERIAESGMEDYVIILGKKENPYPYILACDLYVQPSRYEGKSVCVREAQLLGKPVIITDYPTAHSQLRDGYDGVIVPMDNEGCAAGISRVLRNQTLLQQLRENTAAGDYTNAEEIEKFYKLIDTMI